MQAIILVGGLGTRLSSIVNDRPKPMAKIVNKPFVEYLIDLLSDNGIKDIIFAVGYKGEMIEQYFGNGKERNLKIRYAYEKELLGTGGAIKNAYQFIQGDRVLVLNGDTYYKMDYGTFMKDCTQIDMRIVLRKVADISRYGKVCLNQNRILKFNEKENKEEPGLINGGVYLMKSSLIETIPEGKVSLENEMIPLWLKEGKILEGVVNEGYFIDIGVPEDYYQFIKDIESQNLKELSDVICKIEHLITSHATASSLELNEWKVNMRKCLRNMYGIKSMEYDSFIKMRFEPESIKVNSDMEYQLVEFCREQLLHIKKKYESCNLRKVLL